MTDTGPVRSVNADFYGIFPDLGLYIVADGMGVHAGAVLASQMTVQIMRDYVHSNLNRGEIKLPFIIPPNLPDAARCLVAAGMLANVKIYQRSQLEAKHAGMGTTMVSMVLDDGTGYVTHAGDSRAYLIRNDSIRPMTRDHTELREFESQDLSSKQPAREVLTRALGIRGEVEIDVNHTILQDGDLFLLCSDGLDHFLSDDEIGQQVMENRSNLEEACRHLIELAYTNGGDDNVTVVLIACSE